MAKLTRTEATAKQIASQQTELLKQQAALGKLSASQPTAGDINAKNLSDLSQGFSKQKTTGTAVLEGLLSGFSKGAASKSSQDKQDKLSEAEGKLQALQDDLNVRQQANDETARNQEVINSTNDQAFNIMMTNVAKGNDPSMGLENVDLNSLSAAAEGVNPSLGTTVSMGESGTPTAINFGGIEHSLSAEQTVDLLKAGKIVAETKEKESKVAERSQSMSDLPPIQASRAEKAYEDINTRLTEGREASRTTRESSQAVLNASQSAFGTLAPWKAMFGDVLRGIGVNVNQENLTSGKLWETMSNKTVAAEVLNGSSKISDADAVLIAKGQGTDQAGLTKSLAFSISNRLNTEAEVKQEIYQEFLENNPSVSRESFDEFIIGHSKLGSDLKKRVDNKLSELPTMIKDKIASEFAKTNPNVNQKTLDSAYKEVGNLYRKTYNLGSGSNYLSAINDVLKEGGDLEAVIQMYSNSLKAKGVIK